MFESTACEFGWPCQRLRLGFGLLLFTAFELSLAKQLPMMLVMLLFGLGVASMISAVLSLPDVRLRMQMGALTGAIRETKRSSTPIL